MKSSAGVIAFVAISAYDFVVSTVFSDRLSGTKLDLFFWTIIGRTCEEFRRWEELVGCAGAGGGECGSGGGGGGSGGGSEGGGDFCELPSILKNVYKDLKMMKVI